MNIRRVIPTTPLVAYFNAYNRICNRGHRHNSKIGHNFYHHQDGNNQTDVDILRLPWNYSERKRNRSNIKVYSVVAIYWLSGCARAIPSVTVFCLWSNNLHRLDIDMGMRIDRPCHWTVTRPSRPYLLGHHRDIRRRHHTGRWQHSDHLALHTVRWNTSVEPPFVDFRFCLKTVAYGRQVELGPILYTNEANNQTNS